MATINDFSDILSAMEQNPELEEAMRNHVLGAELRQLPAIVRQQGDQLAQSLARLDELAITLRNVTEQISGYALASSRVIATTAERQDRLELDIAELKAAQARLEAIVQEIRESQARMEGDIVELKADVSELKADMVEVKADVSELKADMVEVKADISELKADMVEVKADVSELKADMVEVKADVSELKADMVEVKADVSELKADMVEVKADVSELKADMVEVKADVSELKADVSELKAGQATTNRRLNRIEGQLGNLNGWRLESDVHKNISSIVYRYLMLEGAYVLKSGILPQTNELDSILRQARIDGRISREQIIDLVETDIIVIAEDDDGQKRVIVAEVSQTLADSDITRAAQRAGIMGVAMETDYIPVAIAPTVAPQQRELAASQGVTIVQFPDPNASPQRPNDRTTP